MAQREVELDQKMAQRDVEVQAARFEDYQAVMDISHDIYNGRDYLPKMYHVFLQDKNSNSFVILLNGRIVGFQNNYIVDSGTRYIQQGLRIAEDCRGIGLGRILSEESERLTVEKYPDLKLSSWSSINHLAQRESLVSNPSVTVPFAWVAYPFDEFSYPETNRLLHVIPGHVPVKNIRQLNLTQSYKIFQDPANQKQLFPDGYFIMFDPSSPYLANYTNLRKAAKMCDIRASFSADGTTCESVAFVNSMALTGGSTRLDIWMYGFKLTANQVLAYIYYSLLNKKTRQFPRLLIYYPDHVDREEVNTQLWQTIGGPLEDPEFDTNESATFLKTIQ